MIVPMILFMELNIDKPDKRIQYTRRLQDYAPEITLFEPAPIPETFEPAPIIIEGPLPTDPQLLVQCTGVHALCIFAASEADGTCNCKTYDSLYQIATAIIKNETIRDATRSYCTFGSPCGINEAPICQAILNNEYYVNEQLSQVASTYSWDSFCERAWPIESWSECNEGI